MMPPVALGFGGGGGGAQAQQKAVAPTPAAPPAPPAASSATAATRSLIRDIASKRSRQTTVLTRERTKLIPGADPGTILGNAYQPPPSAPVTPTITPPPDAGFIPRTEPNPHQPGIIPNASPGSGTVILGPAWAGPGGVLDQYVESANPSSPTYGFTPYSPPAVDNHKPWNELTEYAM